MRTGKWIGGVWRFAFSLPISLVRVSVLSSVINYSLLKENFFCVLWIFYDILIKELYLVILREFCTIYFNHIYLLINLLPYPFQDPSAYTLLHSMPSLTYTVPRGEHLVSPIYSQMWDHLLEYDWPTRSLRKSWVTFSHQPSGAHISLARNETSAPLPSPFLQFVHLELTRVLCTLSQLQWVHQWSSEFALKTGFLPFSHFYQCYQYLSVS